MKLLVALASVLDPGGALAVDAAGTAVVPGGDAPAWGVDRAGGAALEAALRLRRALPGSAAEVVAATVGTRDGPLHHALARGADRGLVVGAEEDARDARSVARALALCARREEPRLVLCGAASSDAGTGCVAAFLARRLGLPHVAEAVGVELLPGGEAIRVLRRLERGARVVVESALPAVVSVHETIAEPRYSSVNARLLAARGDIGRLELPGWEAAPEEDAGGNRILKVEPPKPRTKRTDAPDSRLSPLERMKLLTGGGRKTSEAKLRKGTPEELAEELFRFLREKGFLGPGPGRRG